MREESELPWCLRTEAQFTEPVENISEAFVHGRQKLQLNLLKVFGAIVLQVTVSFADAANNSRRLGGERSSYIK